MGKDMGFRLVTSPHDSTLWIESKLFLSFHSGTDVVLAYHIGSRILLHL